MRYLGVSTKELWTVETNTCHARGTLIAVYDDVEATVTVLDKGKIYTYSHTDDMQVREAYDFVEINTNNNKLLQLLGLVTDT